MKKLYLCMLLWLCFAFSVKSQFQTPKLLQQADVVLRGQVTFVKAYQKENGQIFTRVVVNPEIWYKGNPQPAFVFEVAGGILADIGAVVSHTPTFQVQEEVVIFYNSVHQNVVGGEFGKFSIQDKVIAQEKMMVKDFDRLVQQYLQNPVAKWQEIRSNFVQEPMISKINATITAFSPTAAAAGEGKMVEINGTGFGATKGAGKVEFNKDGDTRVTATVLTWSDTQIRVTVPAGSSSGTIKVSTDAGNVITSVTPFMVKYGTNNRRWKDDYATITYKINANCTDVSGEETALQNAFNTWNAVNSRFQFLYGGSSTVTTRASDNSNDIYWISTIDGAGGVIARNWNYYDVNTGTIYESDIEFDEAETWFLGASSNTQDIESVALHELGHSLHLSDYYDAADAEKVMYGISVTGTTKRALHAEDINGLNALYALYAAATATESPARGGFYASSGAQILALIDNPTLSAGATTPNLTIEAWINPSSLPSSGFATIAAQSRGTLNRGFELVLNSAGKIEFRCSVNGTSVTTILSTTTIPLNQWTHVRGVFRKSISNNNRFMYVVINGSNEATSPVGASPLYDSSANFTVGGYFNFSGVLSSVFQGKIDEVHLSAASKLRSTITPSTAATAATVPVSVGADENSKGLWKFDDITSLKTVVTTSYLDYSGNNSSLGLTATYLAVQLGTFTASFIEDKLDLQWNTQSEKDFYGFEVEYHEGQKQDATFKAIAFIPAKGQENQAVNYQYHNFDLSAGYHTFRLKMIDLDGTVKYSTDIVVFKELSNAFVLTPPYPNPATQESVFRLSVAKPQQVKVEVFNAIGQRIRILYDGYLQTEDAKLFNLKVADLASGLYIIKIKGNHFESSQQVTVIK